MLNYRYRVIQRQQATKPNFSKMSLSSFSDKLVNEITLSTTRGITSVQSLDVGTNKLELTLLAETNTLARDVQHVVNELRTLLANHYGNITVNDHKLVNSSNSLAQIVNDLQTALTTDVTNIKTQLPNDLTKLPQEADNLSNFLKNSSNENDNTKVVYILEMLLTGVFKIPIRNNLEQFGKTELRKQLDGFKIRQIYALKAIKGNDKKTYYDIAHLGNRAIKQMTEVCQALDEDGGSFQNSASKVILVVTGTISDAMHTFKKAMSTSPDAQMLLTAMIVCSYIVYREIDILLQLFEDVSNVTDISPKLNNLILSADTDTLGIANEITLGAQDISFRQIK